MSEETKNLARDFLDNDVLATEEELKGKFLTFWSDGQMFGVPIAEVVSIIGIQTITPVPEYPEYAKGVIDLRGVIIPIIDIRLRLGKEEAEHTERTCIIIMKIDGTEIGFIVDVVNEVVTILDENITLPPKIKSNSENTNAFISGIGKHNGVVILLIETNKLLNEDEIKFIGSFSDI